MKEHPLPTVSTAKQLYATAVACGFPHCDEPLYREDFEAGTWSLNSEISHICARREGGPRWTDEQTSDQNRSADNLILMCHKHAADIDDQHGRVRFTPEIILEWKRAQLETGRKAMGGWRLTEAMAKTAIAASNHSEGIIINNSNVDIGGRGGSAPGAGGGGGGAIGAGARGGRGGHGGRTTFEGIDDRSLALISALEAQEDVPYGAGGGGAPAYGDSSFAGDGGDGGEALALSFETLLTDSVEVELGAGGEAARLPGQHAGNGGDSVITVRDVDGLVKQVFRAIGGAGARSGEFPEDWVAISQGHVEKGFHATTLMAANAIEIRDGSVFLLGGGIGGINLPTLPADLVLNVLMIFNWETLEPHHTYGVHLCLHNSGGTEVARQAIGIAHSDSNFHGWTHTIQIGAPVSEVGKLKLSLRADSILLAEIVIAVVSVNQPE